MRQRRRVRFETGFLELVFTVQSGVKFMIKEKKLGLMLSLQLLLAMSLLVTSEARADAASVGPILPSITVNDAVGTNPGTVYTAGQTQRSVNVTWNAGSEYPYCEIYYTINGANQNELGRGHDGLKPLTVKAGSTYALWMIVYLGAQGQDVRKVAELTVVAIQGNPPAPPSSGGGIGNSTGGPFDERAGGGAVGTLLGIRNVRVQADARSVIIRFNGPPNQVPYVTIGRAAPVLVSNGQESGFGPEHLVGGGFVGPGVVSAEQKARGEYIFTTSKGTTISSDGLDPGTTYHYLITVNAKAGRRPYQDTGTFTTVRVNTIVKVVWERVKIEDDSDDLSTAEIKFWFWTNYGQPSGKFAQYYNRDADSGHTYDINRTVISENVPNLLTLAASGQDEDGSFTSDDPTPGPLDHPDNSGNDENVAKGEFDLSQYSDNTTVPFRLNSMSGGSLKFVIFGRFEITRSTEERTGTTSSPLETAPPTDGRVVRAEPRPRGSGSATPSTLSKCEAAQIARARNSPAAPGLTAQCLATVNILAARGEAIANQDPLAVDLRNQQSEGSARRGFDIGMAAAEGQTAPGPGKQSIHDSLTLAEQAGFTAAVAFSLARNKNAKLATTGAAIAAADPTVAQARNAEADSFYRLGFDIATGIFGDPAKGALGNTSTGPGSLGIRDSLTRAGQRGFNASVALHLSRGNR